MSNIHDTLAERELIYGSFKTHASIAQTLKTTMQMTPKWVMLAPDHQEALEMIQHKIARILNGNAGYADTWHDIAGYATLVEQGMERGYEDELHARPGDGENGLKGGISARPAP